jgi:hypothetical protein
MFVEFDYFSHYLCREIDEYFRFKPEDMIYYAIFQGKGDNAQFRIITPPLTYFPNDLTKDAERKYISKFGAIERIGDYNEFRRVIADDSAIYQLHVKLQRRTYTVIMTNLFPDSAPSERWKPYVPKPKKKIIRPRLWNSKEEADAGRELQRLQRAK